MTVKACFLAAILAAVLICFPAGAQVRSGSGSAGASSSTAQRSTRQAKRSTRTSSSSATNPSTSSAANPEANLIQPSPNGRLSSAFVPFANSFRFDGTSGVPGLGFDFPHLAGVSTGLANQVRPRFGPIGHPAPNPITSILSWGYPFYYDDAGSNQPEQAAAPSERPESQSIVTQQPDSAPQNLESGTDTASLSATPVEVPADVPVPDVSNFILVRRDGRILFASVFSVVGSQLQYVTPEGIRRTLELSDLDADATQQMNEARGTTVQFRN